MTNPITRESQELQRHFDERPLSREQALAVMAFHIVKLCETPNEAGMFLQTLVRGFRHCRGFRVSASIGMRK